MPIMSVVINRPRRQARTII